MNKKFRVSFYLRSYKTKDGKSPVLIRLYLNRERLIIGSTGLYVDEKQWDNTKCRVKGRSTEANKLNEALERIELDLMHLFRRYEFSESLSLDFIKAEYLGVNESNESFIAFFDSFLSQVKEEIGITRAQASYQKFGSSRKHGAYVKLDS